ncbi:MAG: tRNA (adenosine(37)-N6)-dimethylallyltransferase MiaA [Acutalibacteraceae bacterium]
MKKKAIVVVGATASGKTALGVHIAKRFNGEVISADSMQIYKGMDIATAKPTPDEMQGIKHHLIDFLDIHEQYSVSAYCNDARNALDDIVGRGKLPVIVGGTGLYIDSFLSNTKFLDDASSENIRKELLLEAEEKGSEILYDQLKEIDPDAAKNIHPNNTVRIVRALEIYKTTGKTLTAQNEQSRVTESDIEPLYIGINYSDREKLYERINLRVDLMLEKGLLKEAETFFEDNPSKTAINAIGYKELKPFIDGELSLEICVENLKRETRRYAKRQITWFKRNKNINWVYPDLMPKEDLLKYVDNLILNYTEGDVCEE